MHMSLLNIGDARDLLTAAYLPPLSPQIGNTIAGVFCLATMYAMCYGSLGKDLFGPSDA